MNREYLLLWCVLLCNYKVKSIFEQMIRSDIKAIEMKVFIFVESNIVKEYMEYCVTKDRYKFRMALW